MRGPPRRRAHCPMPKLSAGLRPYRLSSGEFPEAQNRVKAGCQRIPDFPATGDVVPVNSACERRGVSIYFLDTTLVSVAKLPFGGEATPPLRSGLRWFR